MFGSVVALGLDVDGFFDEVTKLIIQRTMQTPNTPTIQATVVSGLVFLERGIFWDGGLKSAAATKFENCIRSNVSFFWTMTEGG